MMYDTKEEAMASFNRNQPEDGPTPDWYYIATDVFELRYDGQWVRIT